MSGKTVEGIKNAIEQENGDYADYLEEHEDNIKLSKEALKEAIASVKKLNIIENGRWVSVHTKEQQKAMIASCKKHHASFMEYHEKGLKERKVHHKKTMKELTGEMKLISTKKRCPKGTRKNKSGDCV